MKTVTADAKMALSGSGTVDKLEANADGITKSTGLSIKDTQTAQGVKSPTISRSGSKGSGSSSSSSTGDKNKVKGLEKLTAPNLSYVRGQTLDLSGLTVNLIKGDSSKVKVAFDDFTANGLTVTPTNGSVLKITDNGTKVVVSHSSGITLEVGVLKVVNVEPPMTDAGQVKTVYITGSKVPGSTLTAVVNEDAEGVLTYQWYSSATDMGAFTDILPDGVSKTYTIPDETPEDTHYKVKVTGKDDFSKTSEAYGPVADTEETPTGIIITGVDGSSSITEDNGSLQLIATVTPESADNSVVWSSGDEKIARVDEVGIVMPMNNGKVTITATSTLNPAIKGEMEIEISNQTWMQTISVGEPSGTMRAGQKNTITFPITATNLVAGNNVKITWLTDGYKDPDKTIENNTGSLQITNEDGAILQLDSTDKLEVGTYAFVITVEEAISNVVEFIVLPVTE